MDQKNTKRNDNTGCLKFIIVIIGFAFLGIVWEMITTFVLGDKESIRLFLHPDEGNISVLKLFFWILAIAIVLYFVLGGKIEEIFKSGRGRE